MFETREKSGPSRAAVENAARWFTRLDSDGANAQTFTDWQQWLCAAREHRVAYDEIEETVLRLKRGATSPALPSDEEMSADCYDGSVSVAEWRVRTSRAQRRPQIRRALAAGVALLAVIGAWLWTDYLRAPQLGSFVYQTAPGQKRVVELPEGSKITLDADSALTVRLTRERRALDLSRGEAYFQAARDRARPFVVTAGATQVTALGTAFNVRMSENRTVIAVTEGRVEVVAAPNGPRAPPRSKQPNTPRLTAQLAAGEAVSYLDDGNLHALPAAEASLATGWLGGRRQYRNEPLRYVLADIDRYTGEHIGIADEATGDLRFTGTLSLENRAAWLRGLSVALPVSVTTDADGSMSVAPMKAR